MIPARGIQKEPSWLRNVGPGASDAFRMTNETPESSQDHFAFLDFRGLLTSDYPFIQVSQISG